MTRVISSTWTIPFKVVVPFLLVATSVFLILSLFVYSSQPSKDALIVVLLTVASTVFFCWWGTKLKRVSFDDGTVYVSNLTKQICIPFVEIESVDDFQGGVPVLLRLKQKSEFGQTIFFMARLELFPFYKTHPIVEELRQMVRSSGGRTLN
jgi:hypothetical protein